MTGVIQIFTHRGETREPELDSNGEGGSFDTGHGSAELSGLLGSFDYSVAVGLFRPPRARDRTIASSIARSPAISAGSFPTRLAAPDRPRQFQRRRHSRPDALRCRPISVRPTICTISTPTSSGTAQRGKHWQWRVSGDETDLHRLSKATPEHFVSADQFNRAAFNAQATYFFSKGRVHRRLLLRSGKWLSRRARRRTRAPKQSGRLR